MFISEIHAVFDWIWIGLFTGSCLSKYGQSASARVSTVNSLSTRAHTHIFYQFANRLLDLLPPFSLLGASSISVSDAAITSFWLVCGWSLRLVIIYRSSPRVCLMFCGGFRFPDLE
jgi:hypothetical protein